MNNPGSILKLWSKTVKAHEADKDPRTLPKKGQEQKVKVKKGLMNLKVLGAAEMTVPANAEQFVGHRDKVGQFMTRYCRYLKTSKDEDKKLLPKYLKTVTQLTALVLKLNPGNLSQAEEDPGLDSLADVDVTAVEKALAAPDTGGDIDLDEPIQPGLTTPTQTKPQPEGNTGPSKTDADAAAFSARLKALMPAVLKAQTDKTPDSDKMKLAISEASTFARKLDFAQASALLARVEGLLKSPSGKPTNQGDGPKATDGKKVAFSKARLLWEPAMKEVRRQVQALQKAILIENKDADGLAAAKKVATVLDTFNEKLEDKLDAVLVAPTEEERQPLIAKAMSTAEKYTNYLQGDPLLAHVEVNPYTEVTAKALLLPPLKVLMGQLENQ